MNEQLVRCKERAFETFISDRRYSQPVLSIPRVTPADMGAYMCIAKNTVPPAQSKRVFVYVQCKKPIGRQPIIAISPTSMSPMNPSSTEGDAQKATRRRALRANSHTPMLREGLSQAHRLLEQHKRLVQMRTR